MASSLALVATCALRLVAGASYFDLGGSSEVRAKVVGYGGGTDAEIEVDPIVGMSFVERSMAGSVAYLPRVLFTTFDLGSPSLLHRLTGNADWTFSRPWKLSTTLSGSYGTTAFLSLQPPVPGSASSIAPIPVSTSLDYADGSVSVVVLGPLVRGLDLRVAVTGYVSGSLSSADRQQLPFQETISSAASLGWRLDRTETLSTGFSGSWTHFDPGVPTSILQLDETWFHAFAAPAANPTEPQQQSVPRAAPPTFHAGAGLALAGERVASSTETSWRFLPVANVGIAGQVSEPQLRGTLDLRFQPFVDPVTAESYERFDADAVVTWTFLVDWTLAAYLRAGIAVEGTQDGQKVLSGEARLTWPQREIWQVFAGARGFRQTPVPGLAGYSEVSVFGGASLRLHERL